MRKNLYLMLLLLFAFTMLAQSQDANDEAKNEKKRVKMAKEMLAKAETVAGGLSKIRNIENIHVKGVRHVVDPNRKMTCDFELWVSFIDSSYYSYQSYGNGYMIFISAYNGENAWLQNPNYNNNQPKPTKKIFEKTVPEMLKFLKPEAFDYSNNNLSVKFEDKFELKNGNEYNKIRVTYPDNSQEDFYFDINSSELYKRQGSAIDHWEKRVDEELFFDEWQNVDGLMFPKLGRQVQNGEEMKIYHFNEIEINVTIPEGFFDMPQPEEQEKEDTK